MLKKALWLYLGLYTCGVLVAIGRNVMMAVKDVDFSAVVFLMTLPVFTLSPAAVVALELRDKKVPVIFTLFFLFIFAVMLTSVLRGNGIISPVTLKNGLALGPMFAALLYFAYRRLFKK